MFFYLIKGNTMDFSETIAACDLKVGKCRQLIELMKIWECLGSLTNESFNLLFSETTGPF